MRLARCFTDNKAEREHAIKPTLICPTGARTKPLSTPARKNIFLFRNSDLPYSPSRSAPRKGRIAIATDVARNAVDGLVAVKRAAICADGEVVWF